MNKSAFIAIALLIECSVLNAEVYRAIFWNMESGDSDAAHLGEQIAARKNIDFWGFSEVQNQAVLDSWVAALEQANPGVRFESKLSEGGGSDRLAIIYRSDHLKAVPFSGSAAVDQNLEDPQEESDPDPSTDFFFELDSINVGNTVRPALGIQLEVSSGQQMVALVNHLKCCDGLAKRQEQATQLNAFAIATPDIPIVIGGDFNIPLDSGTSTEQAFLTLMQRWEYRSPQIEGAPQSDVGSWTVGSVLDAVFVTNRVEGWSSGATIIDSDGNVVAASTKTFGDGGDSSDHRPMLLTITSDDDPSRRLDELREAMAEMEAVLARMRSEVERLESLNR